MSQGLKINAFNVAYGNKKVIDNLNTALLPKGEITLLLGPNGSGKSTLLRALAGLQPATGELLFDGVDLMKQSFVDRAKQVVYLPQTLPAGVHLHVLESIIVAQKAAGGMSDVAGLEREVMQILDQLGIAHLALSYLDQLSGGQKQLVGLAQSLVRHPSLLLLDEPLSALDLNYQFHVMDLVRRETQKRNIATVVVIHDINIALRHGDYALMLKEGKLVADGKPIDVINAENLAHVYGVCGRVESCSKGIPQVLIDGLVKTPSL